MDWEDDPTLELVFSYLLNLTPSFYNNLFPNVENLVKITCPWVQHANRLVIDSKSNQDVFRSHFKSKIVLNNDGYPRVCNFDFYLAHKDLPPIFHGLSSISKFTNQGVEILEWLHVSLNFMVGVLSSTCSSKEPHKQLQESHHQFHYL